VKAWLHVITVVGYAVSRGLAKLGQPTESAPVLSKPPTADQGDAGVAGGTVNG